MGRSRLGLAGCVLGALIACGSAHDDSPWEARSDAGGTSGTAGGTSGAAGEHAAGARGEDGGAAGSEGGAAAGVAGADSGCEDAGEAGDATALRVITVFPPRGAYTDADTVLMRGIATAPSGIRSVSVAGVSAISKDGFATWSARVAVANGVHEYPITVTDGDGEVTAHAAAFSVVNRGTALVGLDAMDFDAASGSLLLADSALNGLFRLDLATQRVSPLESEAALKTDFTGKTIALDVTHRRALSFSQLDELVAVDLDTGLVDVLSPQPEDMNTSARAMALDSEHERVFALGQSQLVAIDLKTGMREALDVVSTGQEFLIGQVDDLVYDAVTQPESPRLLLSDRPRGSILAIDLATKQAHTFADNFGAHGAGTRLSAPGRMKLDAERGRLLVVDGRAFDSIGNEQQNRQALVAVDLATGDRTTLSSGSVGSGFLPRAPYPLALDAAGGRAFFADQWGGQIAAFAFSSAERTLVHHANVGSGASLDGVGPLLLGPQPSAQELAALVSRTSGVMAIERATGDRHTSLSMGLYFGAPTDMVAAPGERCSPSALVLDRFPARVYRLDLKTGHSSVISDPRVGHGPALSGSGYLPGPGLELDSASNRVLVVDDVAPALVAVDLDSGDRTILSDATRGKGPAFDFPSGVVLDPTRSSKPRALVGVSDGLLAVDLATGDRSYVTSPASSGPSVSRLASWPEHGSVLALAYSNLYSIDLATGSSVLISGSDGEHSVGAGPRFVTPYSLQIDSEHDLAYVSDLERAAVFAIDLVSGDRVLLAH